MNLDEMATQKTFLLGLNIKHARPPQRRATDRPPRPPAPLLLHASVSFLSFKPCLMWGLFFFPIHLVVVSLKRVADSKRGNVIHRAKRWVPFFFMIVPGNRIRSKRVHFVRWHSLHTRLVGVWTPVQKCQCLVASSGNFPCSIPPRASVCVCVCVCVC